MRILELNQRILAMDRSIQDENVKSAISGEVIEAFVSQQGEFVGQGRLSQGLFRLTALLLLKRRWTQFSSVG